MTTRTSAAARRSTINWSFGVQRQLTNALAVTATYVGSEGHFLQLDSYNARGIQANQLDPKYLYLGSHLSDKGATTVSTDCTPTAWVATLRL
jgi:predicted porin